MNFLTFAIEKCETLNNESVQNKWNFAVVFQKYQKRNQKSTKYFAISQKSSAIPLKFCEKSLVSWTFSRLTNRIMALTLTIFTIMTHKITTHSITSFNTIRHDKITLALMTLYIPLGWVSCMLSVIIKLIMLCRYVECRVAL